MQKLAGMQRSIQAQLRRRVAAAPSSFSNAKTASKFFGATYFTFVAMTFLSPFTAVVGIAVTIAAIGSGATADDAGAGSERKSRLFVVSGAALVQHCHLFR